MLNKFVCVVSFFGFGAISLTASSWVDDFHDKKHERPEWMLKQIKSDLEPFSKTGITKTQLDIVMNRETSLARFEIKGNKVYERKSGCQPVLDVLLKLVELIEMPDVDFIVSCNDSFYHVTDLITCPGPIFSFTKREYDSGVILIPDHCALLGYDHEMSEVTKGNEAFPWNLKEEKAFWRGINSGFLTESLMFMDINNFQSFPRVILCSLSAQWNELLDAGFNFLPDTPGDVIIALHELCYVKNTVSISQHLKYKYQILIDGYTCSWQRGYWQLFCNSVMFKQNSPDYEWYYGALQPYVHFVPVNNDLSDLIEKILWARQNDEKMQKIVQNANNFAKTHLLYNDIVLYVYLLLTEYAKLFI